MSGSATERSQVLDINQVLGEMDESLRRLVGREVEVLTYMQPGLWPVRFRGDQLRPLIVALVCSAREAAGRHGRIWVETANVLLESLHPRNSTLSGPWVLLTVRDDGIDTGCAGTAHLAGGPAASNGNGDPLSAIREIVGRNGGHLTVSRTFQNGSVFRVYLPRSADGTSTATTCTATGGLRTAAQACRWTKHRAPRLS